MSLSDKHSIENPDQSPMALDKLTGLPDRHWLDATLSEQIAKHSGEFSVMFIDLDDVKLTNDTKGHKAGDEYLQLAATTIGAAIRQPQKDRDSDLLSLGRGAARVGGDEFIVILPGVKSPDDLGEIEVRLQKDLDAVGVSASIGSEVHKLGETADTLLSGADAAMYKRKQAKKLLAAQNIAQAEAEQRASNVGALRGRKRIGYLVTSKVLRPLADEIEKRHGIK